MCLAYVRATYTFSNNSNDWHLAKQVCFSLKIQRILHSGPLLTWFLHVIAKTEESIKIPKSAAFLPIYRIFKVL